MHPPGLSTAPAAGKAKLKQGLCHNASKALCHSVRARLASQAVGPSELEVCLPEILKGYITQIWSILIVYFLYIKILLS